MTRKFDENESLPPSSHWECQKCGKKNNLIRPVDTTKQTFCKDCLSEMRSCLDYALHELGLKWHLRSLFDAVEEMETSTEKKFLINHILSACYDRLEDLRYEELENRE